MKKKKLLRTLRHERIHGVKMACAACSSMWWENPSRSRRSFFFHPTLSLPTTRQGKKERCGSECCRWQPYWAQPRWEGRAHSAGWGIEEKSALTSKWSVSGAQQKEKRSASSRDRHSANAGCLYLAMTQGVAKFKPQGSWQAPPHPQGTARDMRQKKHIQESGIHDCIFHFPRPCSVVVLSISKLLLVSWSRSSISPPCLPGAFPISTNKRRHTIGFHSSISPFCCREMH